MKSPFSLPGILFASVLCAGLLLSGCGQEGTASAAGSRDPTLRGLLGRLRESGLEVGEKLTLNPGEDHASRIGRAAGLANELAGANIQSDLATETQRRNLDGRPVLLERFDSSEKASRVFQKRQDLEDRSRNPGGVILLLRGDKILTLRGPTPPPQVRGMPGLPHQRPSGPPDSAWVEKIRTAFESSTAP